MVLLTKKSNCFFNENVDRGLIFKEVYFINTALHVKYNRTVKALLLLSLYESI